MLHDTDMRAGRGSALPTPLFALNDPAPDTEDEDEITRCICGRVESFGVMVQCETCFVWQHCECMNMNPKKLPKNYYCEECKPDGHSLYMHLAPQKTTTRTRELAANAAARNNGKKRSTMNSREAAQSYTELLMLKPGTTSRTAASAAIGSTETYEMHMETEVQSPRRRGSQDDSAMGRAMRRFSGSSKPDQKSEKKDYTIDRKMMEIDTSNIINPNQDNKPPKRKRRSSATETSDPPEHDRASKRRMDTLENPNNHVGVNNTKRESFSQAEDSTRPSLRREATEEDPLSPRLPDSQKTRKKSDNSRKASNQSNSRGGRSTRAPRQSQSSGTSRSKNNSQPIVTSNSATTVEEAPEEHPVKTRIPHAKSSLGEMNKRVKQLSDYITRLQVSMAAAEPCVKLTSPSPSASIPDDCPSGLDSSSDTRTSSQNKFNMTPVKTERHPPMDTTTMTSTRIFNLAILTPGGQMMTGAVTTSPTGSEPAVCSPQTPARAETSFEMLDRLNLSLIRFQERFGSLNTKR